MTVHVFNLRVPGELWERVRASAEAEGRSVHSWVLRAVEDNARWSVGQPPVAVDSGPSAGLDARGVALDAAVGRAAVPVVRASELPALRKERKVMCEHRVPAGQFCKRCG